jgi:alpha-1,3(6)-mannosylglycoprotein beta-1,6-N-acetyl-glucosaminyltransferase
MDIMKQHDIIFFFSGWENIRRDWELLGDDLVTHVWGDDDHVVWCFADPDRCLKSDKNPAGMSVEPF